MIKDNKTSLDIYILKLFYVLLTKHMPIRHQIQSSFPQVKWEWAKPRSLRGLLGTILKKNIKYVLI